MLCNFYPVFRIHLNRKGCEKMMRRIQDAIIHDILKVVSIKSFTGTDGVKECQTEIAKIAKSLGFNVSAFGKGRVLVVNPKNNSQIPELGIITHLDTVPFNPDEWHFNPLGEISNGRIYGRGVLDDKAAIVLSLYAFYLLKDKVPPTWQIIIGSSEEGEWVDMEAYLEEGHKLPKFSITIDGDGVQNGCKGYLDLLVNFSREKYGQEFLELSVPMGKENTVPDKAIANFRGKSLEAFGKATHSSIPDTGENALIKLAKTIHQKYYPREFSGFFKMMNDLSKTSNAISIGFSEKPQFLNGQNVGYTTACPTMCALTKNALSLNLNLRLCPGTSSEDVRISMQNISSKYDCTCYIKRLEYPVYVPSDSKGIKCMLDAYKEVLGVETTSMIANGIGYNAAIPNCVIFGPRFALTDDEPDTCHASDENRSIEDLFKFFDMLVSFCEKYLIE